MSPVVPSRPAPFNLRLFRPAFAAACRFFALTRRPAKPPHPPAEAAYGPHPAERIEYLAPRAGAPPPRV